MQKCSIKYHYPSAKTKAVSIYKLIFTLLLSLFCWHSMTSYTLHSSVNMVNINLIFQTSLKQTELVF